MLPWDSTVGFMLKGAISFVLRHVHTFLRRKLISVWVFGHGVPKEPSMWKNQPHLFLENSATASVRAFLSSRTPGATIFWAVEGAGKTFALSRVSAEFEGKAHRFIYVDCAGVQCDELKRILYRKLGMDPREDLGRFSAYLPSDVFTTIVVDHFAATPAATAFLTGLARDSLRAASFNVLLLLSDPAHAVALLTDRGGGEGGFRLLPHARLLGPAFCGRWSASDLPLDLPQKKKRMPPDGDDDHDARRLLVDQCGTLLPFLFSSGVSDARMQLKIAQSRLAWEEGERLLAGFRGEHLV